MPSRTIQTERSAKGAAEHGRLATKRKKPVAVDDVLMPSEAQKVRHALKQVRAGKTRPWLKIKHELGL